MDKIAKDARRGWAFFIVGGEVGGDAVDVEVNEGLLAIGAVEEVEVLVSVFEEIFHKNALAGRRLFPRAPGGRRSGSGQ